MFVDRFYLNCLSQASYLVGDEHSGQAVVIDPRRDVDDYVDAAAQRGVSITGVINTHFHADFVAGHLELAESVGAWIGYGARAETDYAIRRFAAGDRIDLGHLQLEVLQTPGHTWESISLVAHDDGHPTAVFTGDALFIDDIGRPDLAAAVGADPTELAHAQFHTIHQVLAKLPDDLVVHPAHGAGSACGKNISTELQSTIGEQKAVNWALRENDEDAFVQQLLSGQPAIPAYFRTDALLNREQRAVMTLPPRPGELVPGDVLELTEHGARIVDARDPADFARAHLAQAINVGLDGRFAETAGMIFGPEDRLIIIAPHGRQDEAAMRLGRVGLDRVSGYVDPQRVESELADHVVSGSRIAAESVDAVQSETGAVIVDVRNPGERAAGAIPESLHIPLADLPGRMDEIPGDRPAIVHCGSGWRSSVAASLLAAHGRRDVSDVLGGYEAWQATRQAQPA